MNKVGDIKFCSKCVISNLRPITTVESKHIRDEIKPITNFDDDGVCDACRWAEIKETKIDWTKRENELHELCDKHRSKDEATTSWFRQAAAKIQCMLRIF